MWILEQASFSHKKRKLGEEESKGNPNASSQRKSMGPVAEFGSNQLLRKSDVDQTNFARTRKPGGFSNTHPNALALSDTQIDSIQCLNFAQN